ncbi:MAG: elongation factor G [Aerococcaceae bacterium]|nr:elongation factor G [Aerococcaceae bacterium]
MIINESIQDLILEYVDRIFRRDERCFYKGNHIRFTELGWEKFKQGDITIGDMKARRVMSMLDDLFSPFELTLISKAQQTYYLHNNFKTKMKFPEFYDQYKKELLVKWLNETPNEVYGRIGSMLDAYGNRISRAYLAITLELSREQGGDFLYELRFQYTSPNNKPLPTGRRNHLWLKENLDYLY